MNTWSGRAEQGFVAKLVCAKYTTHVSIACIIDLAQFGGYF